ncbi:MAG: hypothetical protein AAGE96_12365 [Cyanobacteria bacterium P01_G01_bin.19]
MFNFNNLVSSFAAIVATTVAITLSTTAVSAEQFDSTVAKDLLAKEAVQKKEKLRANAVGLLKFDAASLQPGAFGLVQLRYGKSSFRASLEYQRFFNADNTSSGDFQAAILDSNFNYQISKNFALNAGLFAAGVGENSVTNLLYELKGGANIGLARNLSLNINIKWQPEDNGLPNFIGLAGSSIGLATNISGFNLEAGTLVGGFGEDGSLAPFGKISTQILGGTARASVTASYTNSFGDNESFDVPTNTEVGYRKSFGKLTLDAAWRDGNSLGGVLPARSGFNLTTEYRILNI